MNKNFFVLSGVFLGGLFLFAHPAFADNCSFFADCFNTAKAAAAAATGLGILAAIASAAADATPVIGEIKAGVQVITGHDPLTGDEVSRWDSAIGLIPVFGGATAAALRYSTRAARTLEGARRLQTAARVVRTATDAYGEYQDIRKPYDNAVAIRDTAENVVGKINDYFHQQASQAPQTGGSGRSSSRSLPPDIPSSEIGKAVRFAIQDVPKEAPAKIADEALKQLLKQVGKDSETMKSLVKMQSNLSKLPKDARIEDVVKRLKS